MKRWLVVDTNVVVSGTIRASAESPPRRIVRAMLTGSLRFLVSEGLIVEYRRVLLQPQIVARHGLSVSEVDSLLKALLSNAGIREAPATALTPETREGDLPPRGDEHVVALLRVVSGSILITGDRRLAESVGRWCEAFTPAEFATTLGSGSATGREPGGTD